MLVLFILFAVGLIYIGNKEQKKIYNMANYYMYKNHISGNIPVRFDVVAVNEEKIHHIINAFGGI